MVTSVGDTACIAKEDVGDDDTIEERTNVTNRKTQD